MAVILGGALAALALLFPGVAPGRKAAAPHRAGTVLPDAPSPGQRLLSLGAAGTATLRRPGGGRVLRGYLAAGLAGLAAPALAQTPITAEEFDAYTRDRTLIYSVDGAPYGIEQHFEDRRVRWAALGDDCHDGRWYPEGPAICFVYEDGLGPQCWLFFRNGDGLSATVVDDGEAPDRALYETRISDAPLLCPGPRVGV